MTEGGNEIDWELLMRFGLGVLGLAPDEFWSMTPREFDAAVKGRLGFLHERASMTRTGLAELSARFPDGALA